MRKITSFNDLQTNSKYSTDDCQRTTEAREALVLLQGRLYGTDGVSLSPKPLALVCGTALIAVGTPAGQEWADVKKILGDVLKFRDAMLALESVDIKRRDLATLNQRITTLENTDMNRISRLGAALKVWLKAVIPSN